MGILKEPARFIMALELPPGFSVCELGDQMLSFTDPPTSAEPWYRSLGCGRYVSIDGNGRGTLTADLNYVVDPLRLLGEFDLVTDFGTGEHIFDQAQVWRTLHDLTKPGGVIVFDRPAQGYQKHGFYLTTDSLFRDLAAANDYAILWLARTTTPRGELIRGAFRRTTEHRSFRIPQQGRYHAQLRLGDAD